MKDLQPGLGKGTQVINGRGEYPSLDRLSLRVCFQKIKLKYKDAFSPQKRKWSDLQEGEEQEQTCEIFHQFNTSRFKKVQLYKFFCYKVIVKKVFDIASFFLMHSIIHCKKKSVCFTSNLAVIGVGEELNSSSVCVVMYAHDLFFL